MGRRLTEEKRREILEAGIAEFARQGPDRGSMSAVAERCGISVGVLYRYYRDKGAFFEACLRESLGELEAVVAEVTGQEDQLPGYADRLIRALQRHARQRGDCVRLYCRLAADPAGCGPDLAERIEGMTARLYTRLMEEAQRRGAVRRDADPRLLAFFFDNLLMMLQFSLCCDYYRARFRLYCGPEAAEEERTRRELLQFLEAAFAPRPGAADLPGEERDGHDLSSGV